MLVFIFIVFLFSCSTPQGLTDYWNSIQKRAESTTGMVVSGHPLASQAGIRIMQKGGNAVDAAIATQLALAVVYPRAGNLGGGGFMVYRAADGKVDALDYREKAPAAAKRDMYLDKNGIPTKQSIEGPLASGVPGTIDGLITASQKYGKLPFSTLIEPAIEYATKGYKITKDEATRFNGNKAVFSKYNEKAAFIKSDEWKTGDVLVQPELAKTLGLIKAQGRKGFYEGTVANLIVSKLKSGNGIITLNDLASYHSVWRKPVTGQYKDCKIISMPPPSSGGIALLQLLKMVEPYPLKAWGPRDVRTIHLLTETERRVYADRAQYLGDEDYFHVPKDSLLDPRYLKYRMSDFDSLHATSSQSVFAGNFKMALEHFETTHLSVVDKDGNAVSVTTTLNGNFGSKVVVDGAGFFMNNEMDDFSVKPGSPNMFGLIGGDANSIQPGKRMLSSMTPTIVEKNGKLYIVVGSPGGSTIITSVFQTILNCLEWGMPIDKAVAYPRFHHQWLPDEIMTENNAFDDALKTKLSALGHKMRGIAYIGLVDAIQMDGNGKIIGGADPRGDDAAVGR